MSQNVLNSNNNRDRNVINTQTDSNNTKIITTETQIPISEKIQRNFVKNSLISKHLLCTICQEVFDDPRRIECGHTFCYICINQWSYKSSMCPMCRQKFSKEKMSRDLIALNIINDLEVTCSNKGCPWKDSLLNLYEHLKTCYFDKTKMPTYVKNFVTSSSQHENTNNQIFDTYEEDKVNPNDYLNFNCNIGLKARLYQKNKDLMDKVLSQNNLDDSKGKRDSIFDFLSQKY